MTVVVGIDEAAVSGFAVVVRHRPVAWGLAKSAADRQRFIARAVELAGGDLKQVLWVLEDHGKVPLSFMATLPPSLRARILGVITPWPAAAAAFARAFPAEPSQRNTDTVLGLGDARGRWLEQLELLGVTDSRILKVAPTTWRHAVLKRRLPGQTWKATAVQYASVLVGSPIESDDVAEALCIAMWGAFAGVAKRAFKQVVANFKARERRRRKGEAAPTGRQLDLLGKEASR